MSEIHIDDRQGAAKAVVEALGYLSLEAGKRMSSIRERKAQYLDGNGNPPPALDREMEQARMEFEGYRALRDRFELVYLGIEPREDGAK